MARKTFHSDKAPKAIGPYVQALAAPAGRLFFCSGQVPLDPATGELVTGPIEKQAEQVMSNIREVLAAAGLTFDDVVKTVIYLADMRDFAKVNEVYGRVFKGPPPARSTVQVAGLPKGAALEIDVTAVDTKT